VSEQEPGAGAEPAASAPDEKIAAALARFASLPIVVKALLSLLMLLLLLSLVGWIGWQKGKNDRQMAFQQTRSAELAIQVELGEKDLADGRLAIAGRRAEWVLDQVADHAEAMKLAQAVVTRSAATRTPVPTATPRPTIVPTAAPSSDLPMTSRLAQIEQLISVDEPRQAISALVAFQLDNPSFRRHHTDQLLQQAYLDYALQMVDGPKSELAIYYIERALDLGDVRGDILYYREWSDSYLQAISYYGVNWSEAETYLRNLCVIAPYYRDSCYMFREALRQDAELHSASGDFCPAAVLMAEASQISGGSIFEEELEQLNEQCASATPTPSPTVTATPTLEPGLTPTATPFFSPSGPVE